MAGAPGSNLWDNPAGTDGFEFVEYAAPDAQHLRDLFTKMGFPAVAKHKRKDVTLHRQGDINFIINAEPNSFEAEFAAAHGPCACAMAFRVKDAAAAHRRGNARVSPTDATQLPTSHFPVNVNISLVYVLSCPVCFLRATKRLARTRLELWWVQ